MDKNTIQKIAREVLNELRYQGWEVSAVWQQKAIAMPKTLPANGNNGGHGNHNHTARKTWYVDFTNDQGSFPRVYFHCDSDVDEAWIRGEIKQQLQNLRGKLTFMEPLRPAAPETPEVIAAPPPPAPIAVTAPLSPPITKPLPPPAAAKSFVAPPAEEPAPVHAAQDAAANHPVLAAASSSPASVLPPPPMSREEQNTAFLRAASEGRADAVGALLAAGADVDARLGNGMTALIRASFFGHADVVRLLLEKNADTTAKDHLGMTALDWALSKDQIEVINLFTARTVSHLTGQQSYPPPSSGRQDVSWAPPTLAVADEPPVEETVRASEVTAISTTDATELVSEAPTRLIEATPEGDEPFREEVLPATNDAVNIAPPVEHSYAPITPAAMPLAPARARNPLVFYIGAGIIGGLVGFLVFFGIFNYRQRNAPPPATPVAPSQTIAPQQSAVVNPDAARDGAGTPATTAVSNPTPPTTNDNRPKPLNAQAEQNSSSTAASRKTANNDAARPQAALNSALKEWIAATNSRDVKKQMSFYAPKVNTFYRNRNVSRADVQAEKTRVFGQAQSVDVRADKPEITLDRVGNTATMRFRKKYEIAGGKASDRRGEVIQELRWQKTEAGWKIVGERDVQVIQ